MKIDFKACVLSVLLFSSVIGQAQAITTQHYSQAGLNHQSVVNETLISLKIDSDGRIYDDSNSHIGTIESSGRIYNASNSQVGSIDSSGRIYNASNSQIGNVDSSGAVYNSNGSRIDGIEGTEEAIIHFFFSK